MRCRSAGGGAIVSWSALGLGVEAEPEKKLELELGEMAAPGVVEASGDCVSANGRMAMAAAMASAPIDVI